VNGLAIRALLHAKVRVHFLKEQAGGEARPDTASITSQQPFSSFSLF